LDSAGTSESTMLCNRQGCGTNCSTTLFQKIFWYKSIICLFLFIGSFIDLGFRVAHVGIFARIWLFPLVRHDRGRGKCESFLSKTHAHIHSDCSLSLCHGTHTVIALSPSVTSHTHWKLSYLAWKDGELSFGEDGVRLD